MASNLRKYKYDPTANSRPSSAAVKSSDSTQDKSPTQQTASMDITAIKTDILESLRNDIATIIKEEMKNALAEDFATLRKEIQEAKMEINSNTSAIRAEVDNVKANVSAVEEGLSKWSDHMVQMQAKVSMLETEVTVLKEKCEDLEGRMRRGNIRIIGVLEQQGSSTPEAITLLLKEVFQLGRDVRVDRSHRSLTKRIPGGKRRAIIAKWCNEGDAMVILRRARSGKLRYRDHPISIFPDYTASVMKARAVDATEAMDYVNANIPPADDEVTTDDGDSRGNK
uniref:L1 transposable element RRM domain-containing protein n=1 Tax=Acanthochromis polyacanthus TaxID=80966 RepID=A0A3Q1ENL4_9TELE